MSKICDLSASAAAALALCLLAPLRAEASRVPAAAMETRDNLFFVTCKVDRVAERCGLDTGDNAMATLRPSRTADRLPVLGEGQTMGVSGVVAPTHRVKVNRLSVGAMAMDDPDNVQVLIAPRPFSNLGLRFFERLEAVTFDFRHGELRQEGPPRPCSGALVVDDVMRVPATLGGQGLAVAWDTGASATVADAAYVRAHPELFAFVRDLPSGADSTTTGVPLQLFTAKALAICGQALGDVAVVAVDMSAAKAKIPHFPDLTLGANLMVGHVWAFDFKGKTWSFD
jgi:hypothetical protein